MNNFKRSRWGLLFVKTDNTREHAGNIALFSSNGPTVFLYHQEAPVEGWAFKRIWNFYFFAIVHVSKGKSTSPNGWHIVFSKLKFEKTYGGFSLSWNKVQLYASIPRKVSKTKKVVV